MLYASRLGGCFGARGAVCLCREVCKVVRVPLPPFSRIESCCSQIVVMCVADASTHAVQPPLAIALMSFSIELACLTIVFVPELGGKKTEGGIVLGRRGQGGALKRCCCLPMCHCVCHPHPLLLCGTTNPRVHILAGHLGMCAAHLCPIAGWAPAIGGGASSNVWPPSVFCVLCLCVNSKQAIACCMCPTFPRHSA